MFRSSIFALLICMTLLSLGASGCKGNGTPTNAVETAGDAAMRGDAQLFYATLISRAREEYGNPRGLRRIQRHLRSFYDVKVESSERLFASRNLRRESYSVIVVGRKTEESMWEELYEVSVDCQLDRSHSRGQESEVRRACAITDIGPL